MLSQLTPLRIVIYAADVMKITGRKESAARKLLAKIRKEYKKQPGNFLTVKEFCRYTGFEEEVVNKFLVG